VITRIIELSCDYDECDVAYAPNPQEMTSLRLTRIGSMIAGWTRADGKDFCPEHPQTGLVDRIRQLAGQRLTDGEIAARLGISRTTANGLRRANNIPPGLGRVGRPSHGFRRSA
jgi:hypothetical protein